MSQLSVAEVGPAKLIVAKRGLRLTLVFLFAHSNLQLVLSSGVSYDLPVVDSLSEAF